MIPGAPGAVVKKVAADSVQVGDLTLRDIPVLVCDRHFGDGIHGVLPLSLFSGYLVRLDLAGKSLDLMPYPDELANSGPSIRAISSNDLLFLSGTVNRNKATFCSIPGLLLRHLAKCGSPVEYPGHLRPPISRCKAEGSNSRLPSSTPD
ncbi:MAG TPA: hypothetical protein VKU19_20090 [Bryobacteraceae bacterium]|nr:hypothetical protein [Bryobacteraceae bacterium]